MALELIIFSIIIIAAAIGYFGGIIFKLPHLFILGCALLIGSGALLWGFDGLITSYYYDLSLPEPILTPVIVDMTNIGLQMFALGLISLGVLSSLVIDFGSNIVSRRGSPFHF
jgi:hypothetical protein